MCPTAGAFGGNNRRRTDRQGPMGCRAMSRSAAELGGCVQIPASTRRRPGEGEPERGRDAGRGVPAAPSPRALEATRRSAARGPGAGRWLLHQLCAPHRCQAPSPRPAPEPLSLSARSGPAPQSPSTPVHVRAPLVSPSPPSARPSPESLPQLPLERQEAAAVGRGDADGHLQHRQVFLVLHLVPAPLAGRAPPPPPPPQTQPLQAPHRSALGHPPPRRAPGSRSCRRAWPARAAVRGPVPPPCAPSARSPPPGASSALLRTGGGRGLEAALSEPCTTQVRTPRASVSPRGLAAYLQSITTAKNLRPEKKNI